MVLWVAAFSQVQDQRRESVLQLCHLQIKVSELYISGEMNTVATSKISSDGAHQSKLFAYDLEFPGEAHLGKNLHASFKGFD